MTFDQFLPIDLKAYIQETERKFIDAAMRAAHGNGTKAAELLGMQRATLVMKRRRLGMPMKKGNGGGRGR